MSKTSNIRLSEKNIRWRLLATVSAAALLASAYGAGEAQAADSDRPPIWIELGGQLERLSDQQEPYSPPFAASITQTNLLSALNVQKPPAYALAADAKISFQPDGSDWLFSASIQYGRSNSARHRHQQIANAEIPVHYAITFPPPYSAYDKYKAYTNYPSHHLKFADGKTSQSEKHLILDFQVGKDVGLGLFGKSGSSVLSAGVRIAQFGSNQNADLRAEPDVQYPTAPITSKYENQAFLNSNKIRFHDYNGILNAQRNFRGLGPSLAWSASVPVAGNTDAGEISLDWGANVAALFGKQRVVEHHKTTTENYYLTKWVNESLHETGIAGGNFRGRCGGPLYAYHSAPCSIQTNTASHDRSRAVTVPNLGGFAGISYRYADAKISFGYRADFFFNAIDGGIDTRKSENRAFYGPYASISIGLGD